MVLSSFNTSAWWLIAIPSMQNMPYDPYLGICWLDFGLAFLGRGFIFPQIQFDLLSEFFVLSARVNLKMCLNKFQDGSSDGGTDRITSPPTWTLAYKRSTKRSGLDSDCMIGHIDSRRTGMALFPIAQILLKIHRRENGGDRHQNTTT